MRKPLPTPLELRMMPLEKRMTPLVKLMYWKTIDEPMVSGKHLSSTYWKIYRFLQKQEESTINLLYDYLWSIEPPTEDCKQVQDMTAIFRGAYQWNTRQRMETSRGTEEPLEEYRDFLDILKEW